MRQAMLRNHKHAQRVSASVSLSRAASLSPRGSSPRARSNSTSPRNRSTSNGKEASAELVAERREIELARAKSNAAHSKQLHEERLRINGVQKEKEKVEAQAEKRMRALELELTQVKQEALMKHNVMMRQKRFAADARRLASDRAAQLKMVEGGTPRLIEGGTYSYHPDDGVPSPRSPSAMSRSPIVTPRLLSPPDSPVSTSSHGSLSMSPVSTSRSRASTASHPGSHRSRPRGTSQLTAPTASSRAKTAQQK